MLKYILKRLLLIVPTLLGVLLINFIVIQAAPGGPVEQAIARIKGYDQAFTERFTSANKDFATSPNKLTQGGVSSAGEIKYSGSRGLHPEIVAKIEKIYGFDKPAHERFLQMLKKFITFDFDTSFYRDQNVLELIKQKLPVSISLGLWTTLLTYLVSIPLGIRKAVKDGSNFDVASSFIIIIGYAIPSFLFAILLIVLFAGGSYFSIFPLKGLVSDNFEELNTIGKIKDYLWHITLPIISMVIGGFASLTLLCKNSFLEEISKNYVITARAKGCTEKKVLYGHIFRNAMLIVIAGFPSAFVGILFAGAFLIEIIFSLDGLGLLAFEATISRDYPVIFGSLFIFTLLGLILNLIGDIMYVIVDPRIDFERR
ncbi:MAG: microcin C ABC transporter permease YejB [Rickettsiales bacterium]|nr:microcin C ABC transporter permease YejB [Rickettsiales bacterium]